jgi:restriction endonuclease Mrr
VRGAISVRWLDAAERVLEDNGTELHYVDLAESILHRSLVATESQTPAITLHAVISLDTKRRSERGLPPRFVIHRGGMVTLAKWESGPIEEARDALLRSRERARRDLLRKLRELDGSDFETFLERLFTAMGYDVTVVGGTDDDGVDLVAEPIAANVGSQRIGIQAKCRGGSRKIGQNTVRLLRDALGIYGCSAGAVVATVGFDERAAGVALEPGRPPVDLVDHERLTELAIQFKVGVKSETIEAYSEDLESVFTDDLLDYGSS